MNTDLAFCLNRFLEEQVQLIEECIDKIQQEEENLRQESSPTLIEQRRSKEKKKGTHDEDQFIVDQFLHDLQESMTPETPIPIEHNKTIRENLRAELSTKLSACSNYLTRLRNLSKLNHHSESFVQRCNEAIDLLRRGKHFDNNYNHLSDILTQSDPTNCIENVKQWWKETYGYIITEINQNNKQYNPAITENHYAVLSSNSRIIQHAKKLVELQKPLRIKPTRSDVILEFIQHIQQVDEDVCRERTENDLIQQLDNENIQIVIDYAETWLKKRDEIRSQIEENPYEIRWEKAKAEFDRQIIAQQSKKVALATLLRRLAVGSENLEQFDQNFQNLVQQQDQTLPIVIGDIGDPTVAELPLLIQLTNVDVEQWSTNADGIREQLGAALCVAFLIPVDQIRIDGFEPDDMILKAFVLAPYGKNVIDCLNGTAPDSAARIEAVQQCCASMNVKIQTLTLGSAGLNIEDRLMDPQWNRKYTFPDEKIEGGEYWAEPLIRGGKPYHCPSGWMRFGVKVAENDEEFDKKWGDWYIAYHGTQGEYAASILSSGLRVSTTGCFYEQGRPRVYVSPSIEYCAHPRYAHPWKKINENGEITWYQLIFQCRVNPNSVQMIEPETLIRDEDKETIKADRNFDNTELTWVIPAKEGVYYMNEDIICYGIMMRTSNIDPKELPQCAWWQHAYIENFPYDI